MKLSHTQQNLAANLFNSNGEPQANAHEETHICINYGYEYDMYFGHMQRAGFQVVASIELYEDMVAETTHSNVLGE